MSSAQSSHRHKRGNRGSESTSRTQPTSTSTAITKSTKSSGSYDPGFHQRMIDNNIYPYGYEYPDGRVPPKPENWKEIQQMLAERRASLSPSVFPEEEYDKFARADAQVTSENKATQRVIPMIQGTIRDQQCVDGPDIPFNNISSIFPNEDENAKKRMAKPDVWYGARPEQIDPPRIRGNDELGTYIVPSTKGHRPCAPNFFVEAKGPSGSNAVGLDQACFDGAIGARGMHSLQTYGQQVPAYDNNAYTLSAMYHAGQLKMYAHHPGQPGGSGTNPEYYMNQLKAWAMTSDRETLLKGMTAFRNGVEWTEAQRNAVIEHANAVANGLVDDDDNNNDDEDGEDELAAAAADPILSSFTSQSPFSGQMTSRSEATRQDSDTSTDELALNLRPSKRSTRGKQPRRAERSEKHSSSRHSSKALTGQPGRVWAWRDSAYRCYEDQTEIKWQTSAPADEWVYYEQGWPDGSGKKWRRWLSTTGQRLYQ